ncbi:hypothetical protein QQ045_022815 [Rhodiola kirilowii]
MERKQTDQILPSSAQQLSLHGLDPPPRFIVNQTCFGNIESSPPLGQIPIIDIALLSLLNSSLEACNELHKLRSALSSWGTFQAVNHGIPGSFLGEVRSVAREFFALPMDEKMKSSRQVNDREGYGNDIIVSDEQTLDWTDRLVLGILPEDSRKLHLWPAHPPRFSEVLLKYTTKIKFITDVVLKAMAISLNLDENSFLDQYGESARILGRFNYYPRCSKPDAVLGLKAHTDGAGITVLLQDEVIEGLQVMTDGQWFRAPIIPNSLIINLGDQMQIMSNGIFKSPLHRVTVSSKGDRLSVAMFKEPGRGTEIGPVSELVTEARPRLYRNLKDYGAINFECFQKGIVPLDTVSVRL